MRISDWSSDVCSSDLQAIRPKGDRRRTNRALVARWKQAAAYRKITFFGDFVNQAIASNPEPISLRNDIRTLGKTLGDVIKDCEGKAIYDEIGRASGRERVCKYVRRSVVAGSLKKKKETKRN